VRGLLDEKDEKEMDEKRERREEMGGRRSEDVEE